MKTILCKESLLKLPLFKESINLYWVINFKNTSEYLLLLIDKRRLIKFKSIVFWLSFNSHNSLKIFLASSSFNASYLLNDLKFNYSIY